MKAKSTKKECSSCPYLTALKQMIAAYERMADAKAIRVMYGSLDLGTYYLN